MSAKSVIKGYSGYCVITCGARRSRGLLTSFNLVVNNRLIQSGAANKIRTNQGFTRVGLNAIRDFPSYQLSVTFECSKDLYDLVYTEFKNDMFQEPFKVELNDDSYGLTYEFEQCYLTSFSLSIEKENIASISLSFAYFHEDFEVLKATNKLKDTATNNSGSIGVINKLMPYYRWRIDYSEYNYEHVLSFSLNFSRQITPIFGCTGEKKEDNAIGPLKLYAGLPVVTFQLQYLYIDGLLTEEQNDFGGKSNDFLKKSPSLTVSYVVSSNSTKTIKFAECVTTAYTPNLVNIGSYNTLSISGKVFGKIGNNGGNND